MALIRNTAEGQTNGTALTTANSGGSSGDAFGLVSVVGGTVVFSTDHAAHGTRGYKITCAASQTVDLRHNGLTGHTSAPWQTWLYLTGNPPSACDIGQIRSASGVSAKVQIDVSAGQPRLKFTNGSSSIVYSTINSIPINQWIRVELLITVGTTATNGRAQGGYWLGDATTAASSFDTAATTDTGTATVTEYRYGKLTAAPAVPVFYLDDVSTNPGATAFIGPPAGSTLPVLTASRGSTIVPITATATNGGVVSLVQTSGPTATITGPDATGLFKVALPSGQATNIVVSATATNSGGTSAAQTFTITPTGGGSTVTRDFLEYDGSSWV